LEEVGGAGIMRVEHSENGAEQSAHPLVGLSREEGIECNVSGKTDDGEAGCGMLPFARE